MRSEMTPRVGYAGEQTVVHRGSTRHGVSDRYEKTR